MTGGEKKKALLWLADGFDLYLNGRIPPGGEDDLLSKYVRDVIDRNPNLGGEDPLLRESFKDNLISFLSDMMDKFDTVDRGSEYEKLLQRQFMKGSVSERREMWRQVSNFTGEKYSPLDLNTQGYASQLNENNARQIFDMFMKEWKDVSDRRNNMIKSRLLASAASQWEKVCQQKCQADYLERKRLVRSHYTNPVIDEIVRVIGRGNKPVTGEKTRIAGSYRPMTLSSTPSFKEVDRITAGNDIDRMIPAEYINFADPHTEILFLKRYAQRELRQFTAPANDWSPESPSFRPVVRPAYGPIIVSVDTSSSMDGRPAKIAFAMLQHILSLAKKEKRACYLITFSVRSKAIDLTEPGQWSLIEDFLTTSFSGGTNGESMLLDAVSRLRTDNFSMADVLIISDFAFAPPTDATLLAMRREQLNDTRFYGLKIGPLNTPYGTLLDRLWVIE